MLLQPEIFRGSKTFHGSPRPFASTFLCKGIALCFMLEFPILNLPILASFKRNLTVATWLLTSCSHPWWNCRNSCLKPVLFQRFSWCAAARLLRPQEGQYLGVKMLLSDANHLILHLFGWFFSYLNKLEQARQRAWRESFPG